MEKVAAVGRKTSNSAVRNGFESGLSDKKLNLYTPMMVSERGKAFIDFALLCCGVVISSIGLMSVLAHAFSWPQPQVLPGGILYWVSYPVAWALMFLGVGAILTLQSCWYDMPADHVPGWLKPARVLSVCLPALIGLYYVTQYLILVYQGVNIFLVPLTPALPAAFFSASYTLSASLVLLAFWLSNRTFWVSTYLVGTYALFLMGLCIFVSAGHVFQSPVLFNFKMSLFSAVAFGLVGVAMLLGTLPKGGLMLPLISGNLRVRILSYFAVICGLIILGENISTIGEVHHHLSLNHLLTASDLSLYAVLELTSTLTCVAVITLFLRALTYYNDSMVFARNQVSLARKEKATRKVLQAVHRSLDLEDTFQTICEGLGKQLNVDRCFIACFEEGKLLPPVKEYRSSPEVMSLLTIDVDLWDRLNQFSQLVCLTERPLEFSPESGQVETANTEAQGAAVAEVSRLLQDIHLRSGIGSGVMYRGKCMAALFLHHTRQSHVWTQEEKEIIQIVADQVAVAIYQSKLYEELRHSEQRFRLLVDGAKEYALYMLDPQGYIKTWNQGTERLSGYSADEVLGRHFSRFYIREESPDWLSAHVLEMAKDTGYYEEEALRQRKDGSYYWVSVATSALYDEAGHLIGYSRLMQDVTERKKVEQELQQAKLDAELANQRKSKSLAVMSHEFKTSLNAIIGYADMLNMGKSNSPARMERYTKNIANSGRYLLNIVNDILDIAQAESGKMRLAPRWLDPRQLMLELEPMIRPQAESQSIQIRMEIAPDLPQVFWDPSRCQQAFLNLLSNAVKYNRPKGLVTVEMTASMDRDAVTVRVQDTGIGIPEDKLDDIFTEFFRVAGTAQNPPGTGLGLTLTRQLVELHGGLITVESLIGVGTTFSIVLPVHAPLDAIPAPIQPEAVSRETAWLTPEELPSETPNASA